jgi:hypothetical protein
VRQVLGFLRHLAEGAALGAHVLARATNPNILGNDLALLVRDGGQIVPGNAMIEEGLDLACAAYISISISSCSPELGAAGCTRRRTHPWGRRPWVRTSCSLLLPEERAEANSVQLSERGTALALGTD